MSTLRIALICPYSLSLPGGVQGQVLGLARSLRKDGHVARVLAPCDGPPPDTGVTPLGKSVPFASNGSVAPIAPDVSCALRTIRALRDERFDVIHLHEPLAPGPTLTALLFSETPTVGTFHRAGGEGYQALRFGTRWAAKRLRARCAVSRDAGEHAEAAWGGKYELLFNGIEIERFAKATPWPASGPTIFFIARHEPRKGLDVLLDAMRFLPKDTRLWIAGFGPRTEEMALRTAGDPRIEWLGRISDDEAASRMRGADVFCAPSLHGESFGVVLLEAMAAGVPVVASDLAGYRNVASSGKEALLVPPGEVQALAEALSRVLSDRALAEDLIAYGNRRAEEFSMDELAGRYLSVYERVLS